MARLCIRIAPNEHPTDASLNALRTHEGDVVCLVDDTHVFSHAELNNGQYRIIDVPGVPQENLVHLVRHEEGLQGQMTKRRMVKIDLAATPMLPPLTAPILTLIAHRDEALTEARMARRRADEAANDVSRHLSFAQLASRSGLMETENRERENAAEAQIMVDQAEADERAATAQALSRAAHPLLAAYVREAVLAIDSITRVEV